VSGGRSRLAHAEGGHEEGNGERWLLTYADMITLLLALFIVLFALSTISEPKFLAFKLGITETFNPAPINRPGSIGLLKQTSLISHPGRSAVPDQTAPQSNQPPNASNTSSPNVAPPSSPSLSQLARQLNQALGAQGLAGVATVTLTTKSVVVQILADKAFFTIDSADLGVQGIAIVDAVADVLRPDPNAVEIDGYTDNQPIYGGPYATNWELSAARAATVVNRLNTVDGVAADRLSAVGYGETHPLAPNNSPANQAMNRRIDFVILSPGDSAP